MAKRNIEYDADKLWDLIEQAKGEDRTYKEFAEDLKVDQTTISKIKNKSYRPGKKMLKKIADISPSVAYEDLLKAAGYRREDIELELATSAAAGAAVLLGGIGMLPATVGAMTAINLARKLSDENKAYAAEIKQYQLKQKQFRATAFSIIYRALIESGFKIQEHLQSELEFLKEQPDVVEDHFDVSKQEKAERWYLTDTFVLEDDSISKWDFIYISDEVVDSIAKKTSYADLVNVVFERLVYTRPDPGNTTVVLSNDDCFKEFIKLKDSNSLKKNLSVMLIDKENVQIKKEEVISTYSDHEMRTFVRREEDQ